MVPSRVAGGAAQSSSSSGIFFQGDGQGQVPENSQFKFWKLELTTWTCTGTNSVGASSLVTDANSGLSGGPHLQRSASVNTESYMRLPASPMSFSSNNISISGSSVMDGSSVVQQSSNQDPGSQHTQQHHGVSSATSLPRMGQIQFPGGARLQNSFAQDQTIMSQLQKKPRLDIKQKDIVQQQVLQQLLQRQDSMHLQNPNPQLQGLIQQQRLRQQEQQILQAMPPLQRAQLLQQQQQLQDNVLLTILLPIGENLWRSITLYAAMDAWQCDICGSKSGRGFEEPFEVLPRLNEIKFASGVIDELLFLDLPCECRFPSGLMMLEYAKAVQESVYEQLRMVREGFFHSRFKDFVLGVLCTAS
ncbi:putative transcriptional regulator SLK2 [Salvia divinorum]|uniref:Transcriptional regulator SLK2 n=1 Tax=Salvia divinorum TaxID=28513 RepID=A0ABD1H457_SALDI